MNGDIYEIDLELKGKDDQFRVTLSSLDGAVNITADAPLEDWERARGFVPRIEQGSLDQKSRDRLSQLLNGLLFPGDIKAKVAAILGSHAWTRVWLSTTDTLVMALPWEEAHAPTGPEGERTLTMIENLSFFRRPTGPYSPDKPEPFPDGVVVKFVVGPDTVPGMPSDKLASPDELLRGLEGLDGLRFDVLRRQPWDAVRRSLGDAHILHFSGHAVPRDQEQALVLYGELPDAPDYVKPETLSAPLTEAHGLKLVVLAACSTGWVSPTTVHSGWSALNCGALIAMPGEVVDDEATAFTRAFYSELSASGDLDRAVTSGRRSMSKRFAHRLSQSVVVYCRYSKGPIIFRTVGSQGLGSAATSSPRGRSGVATPSGPRPRRSPEDKRGTKPVVRRFPHGPQDAELSDWLDQEFGRAVGMDAGALRPITFFVGPGMLQIAPAQEQIRWDRALDRAITAANDMPGLGRFLRQLLEARAYGRVHELFVPQNPEEASLSRIRLELAQLAYLATKGFVSNAHGSEVPLNLWDDHGVPLPADDPVIRQLRATIDALGVHIGGFGRSALFGEKLTRDRLVSLLDTLEGTDSQLARLTGSTVQWLTDLFWNAVIFDSPLYPRVEELSFQVSLLVGRRRHPIRRLDPPGAVIRDNLASVCRATRTAVQRGYDPREAENSLRRQFFHRLAEVLHAEYRTWRSQRQRGRLAAPFALTTNFDLELERALAASGSPYHVAIPVYIGMLKSQPGPNEATDEDVRWLVGRFDPTGPHPALAALAAPASNWQWMSDVEIRTNGGLDLVGPLVVKLNGSPLHRIPSSSLAERQAFADLGFAAVEADQGPEEFFGPAPSTVEMEHAIALGEYDFLQVTRISQWSFDRTPGDEQGREQGLPNWAIREIRRPDRYWLLLGCRFADWNSRTQMHTFLGHAAVETDRGCAISLEFDPDRIRFLDWLGITQARGDARLLIDPLGEFAATRRGEGA